MTSKFYSNGETRVHHARPCPLDFRILAGKIKLTGYALQWAVTDDTGIYFDATARSVSDLPSHEYPLIRSHHAGEVIGSCILEADSEGLFVSAIIDHEPGGDVASQIENGRIGGFSADVIVPPGGLRRGAVGPVAAEQWEIGAVSLVDIRRPTLRAGAQKGALLLTSKAELVDTLRAAGISRAAAERVAAGGWNALETAVAPTVPSLINAIENLKQSLKESNR
ncbi:hypothetical protein [Mesorhizobium sp. DCY119]|uniref:hypothetical protein n=1 Tax=Mesorhizobium sp. DCY119 TaxID=2108445 RepID=UPI001058F552|nr:hypothetical protein [Mesorhizobium sp. DCY119]